MYFAFSHEVLEVGPAILAWRPSDQRVALNESLVLFYVNMWKTNVAVEELVDLRCHEHRV